MPTPPLSPELAQQAVDAVKEHGSQNAAAMALGIPRPTLQNRLRRARQWENASDGQKAAVEVTGLDIGTAKHGWRVIRHEDGSRDSVFWKADEADQADIIEQIRDSLSDIPAAPVSNPPAHVDGNLATIYPIADAHVGMQAWGAETGEAYDTRIAVDRLVRWISRAIAASPPSHTAIILDVGDLQHADDQRNVTPASKHQLDVDQRFFKTTDMTIAALVTAVDLARSKHQRVVVRILPGNHNPHAYVAILFALVERYRDDPRVEVQKVPGEFFVMPFGRCLFAAHHGDKAKPERMVMFLADEYAEQWGASKHRFLWTGHLHHHKSADIGGVTWEQLRAVAARDAHAVANAYSARAQLQAITFDRDKGEIMRVKVAE